VQDAIAKRSAGPPLPTPDAITASTSHLTQTSLPARGLGDAATLETITSTIIPSMSSQTLHTGYLAFVSGGCLPIAGIADNIATAVDSNVMVHTKSMSAATLVEATALRMLVQLLNLPEAEWQGRTMTSGATGSNILALAAGLHEVLNRKLRSRGATRTVSDVGVLRACLAAGVMEVKILCAGHHSSIGKAASILGLGRDCVVDVADAKRGWALDLTRVENLLKDSDEARTVYLFVVTAGEVNTGRLGTEGSLLARLHALIQKHLPQHGAWIHVDGAFGIFNRALPAAPEFQALIDGCQGLEHADSIAADAHKCLNVPYDCAFVLTRQVEHLRAVCSNGTAAYLAAGADDGLGVESPMNVRLENSSRFRALPVYAVLLAHGRAGLAEMFAGQVRLARFIVKHLQTHPGYTILGLNTEERGVDVQQCGISVLFSAVDDGINDTLLARINNQNLIFVSGTAWEGRKAVRIAVAGWKTDVNVVGRAVVQALEGAIPRE
jgi:glutamate/tyrosine decarboxylase-like PLP-dependent enzyme